MREVKLNNLKVGAVGAVALVGGNSAIKTHLDKAGFFVGSKVMVLNISPYKNSYLLDVNGKVMRLTKKAVSLLTLNVN